MVLQAGTGAGKTSTLVLLAANTRRRGRYLAFNAHATAFAAVGHRFTRRVNSPRQPAWRIGQALGVGSPVRIGDHEISHRTLSHTVLRTVTRFCQSADKTPAPHHVPALRRLAHRTSVPNSPKRSCRSSERHGTIYRRAGLRSPTRARPAGHGRRLRPSHLRVARGPGRDDGLRRHPWSGPAPTPARTFSGVGQYTVAEFRPHVRCPPARGCWGGADGR